MNSTEKLIGLFLLSLCAAVGVLIWGVVDMAKDQKQEPVELTGMYVIQKYELADIENRIFDLERRLSEVEGE